MAISDIPGYIMGHRFSDDPADYDSVNKRWYDKAGYGALGSHCEVVLGDPAGKFANVPAANNRRGVLMDNTWHAKMRCPIPWQGSVLMVCRPQNISGATTRGRFIALFGNAATATSNGNLQLIYVSTERRIQLSTPSAQVQRQLSRTDDAVRFVAFSIDQSDRKMRATTDGITVTEATAPASTTNGNAVALQAANEGVRVGNLTALAGDLTEQADLNLYLFEWHFFKGNILTGPALAQVAAEIAALRTHYVQWTPAELTTALWLDAADASTITLNGSTVSQWRDKSGNGRHVAQATATKQPTYTLAAQNSLNVLSFDGNNRSLFASSGVINIPQPFSRFVAGQFLVKANQSILIDSDTNNTQCLFYNGEVGTNWVVANGIAPTFKSYSYGTRDFLSHQHSHIVNDAQSYWGIDGSSLTGPLDGGPGGQAGVRIGQVRTELSTSYAFNGRVFEIVLLSGVASETDRQKLEGYLAHKWGLTANLPSGHPYKLTPPTL